MFGIREFLLNMLFIILEIFVYQIFWADRIRQFEVRTMQRNQILVFFLSVVSISLCIYFPVSYTDGFRYDLRHIPLLIGILYGGNAVGVGLLVFIILFRLLLGGGGVGNTVIVFTLFTLISMLIRPHYHKLALQKKLWLSAALTFSFCLVPLWLIQFLKADPFLADVSFYFPLSFTVVSILTVCIAIYLIERSIEMVQMRVDIEQAEKMNMLGELTASIAHEIRNPMTASRGFMQLIKERAGNEADQKYAEIAISEIDRAQETISEYLSFAKPEMEETETIDLSLHMKSVISIISGYAAVNNVDITCSLEKAVIHVNPGKLTQCLVNIIKNAVEACEGNGQIHIATSSDGDRAIIRICDNGAGMDEDQLQRLGTPYYSTKEKGTGLGLMVCYRIISMMRGRIQAESTKGEGTCFTIFMPASL
ncbi:ATP-binding protein [Peribacillus sp. SCS-37]|uniref:ATP-binding protein n=1 Tax=Paraperibacillus esterisolvens TaxID=3115296 RepID=UPI003905EDF1